MTPEEIVESDSVNQSRKNEAAIAKNPTVTITALDRGKTGKMELAVGLPLVSAVASMGLAD